MGEIDWTPLLKYEPNENECRCGKVFISHSKFVKDKGMITRFPCPGCGRSDRVRRSSSPPEKWSIDADCS